MLNGTAEVEADRVDVEESGAVSALESRLSPSSITASFTKTPLLFLREWMALKQRAQDFSQSPIWDVISGKRVDEKHPYFRAFEHVLEHIPLREGWMGLGVRMVFLVVGGM